MESEGQLCAVQLVMSRYQRVSEPPAVAEGGSGGPPPPPPPAEVPVEPPPPYEAAQAAGGAPLPPPPPPPPSPPRTADKAVRFELPPAYDAVTNPAKLPSYDEVQQEKAREGGPLPPSDPLADELDDERAGALHLWRISSVGLDPEAAALHDQQLLGTDLMFFTAFLAAFLFNWIGFLLLLCFCHSVAGRYGALAGFGLSLAKWTLIVKNSTTLVSHDNSWLWWLIMAFGLVISVRAILQYLYIKREWRQLPTSARQRLIFFY
ncbi:NEDD4 family-interacting protein 1-like isoform X1 [Amphibalanus amphitrite]|uniref:NEDD4 family-interacting protein 1-like isoform X1 n=1 Tax=Amphibalanus amphitrite TaxID=1232801 RepID=UPI001C910DEC|nr:NEDD4 family-interacting protein 1-like isoform X1 [Amphibalanus amphitrite]